MTGIWLILITMLLVAVGCILYVYENVGWAQLCWVLASGTAGGAIVIIVERRE